MPADLLDLDAAIREANHPDGFQVRFLANTYDLPAELPADVFAPLLSRDLDLVGAVRFLVQAVTNNDSAEGVGQEVLALLLTRPDLPTGLLDAVQEGLRRLLGQEQYERLVASRPSVQRYAQLLRGLFDQYGVGLGEAFASAASSARGGQTSSATSNGSTASTPVVHGQMPDPRGGGSESAG